MRYEQFVYNKIIIWNRSIDKDEESKKLKDLIIKKNKSEESKLDIVCPKCGHKIKLDIKGE